MSPTLTIQSGLLVSVRIDRRMRWRKTSQLSTPSKQRQERQHTTSCLVKRVIVVRTRGRTSLPVARVHIVVRYGLILVVLRTVYIVECVDVSCCSSAGLVERHGDGVDW